MDLERVAVDADAPVLLVTVAHHTGDLSILKDGFRPDSTNLFDPDAGLSPETQAEMRELAVATLRAHGDAPAAVVSRDALRRMIAFLVGDETVDAYEELLIEELGLEGLDLRAPGWRVDDIAPGATFDVAIIGAGMSGLAAAHRLLQAGIGVTIYEKNSDVGGTWFENVYPGSRVDVANHLYSYSFFQTIDWPEFYSAQEHLLDYFRRAADELDLRKHIRFGQEVTSVAFDDETQRWRLSVGDDTSEFNAVISAVGQLNRPKFPELPGQDRFQGPSFHSARWDYDVDIEGKRVAVIGTGASAAQFVPYVAERASELVVYQRTPPWLAPTPNYHDALPEGLRTVMSVLKDYVRWDRLWLFWRTHEGLLPAAKVDPDWQQMDRSVSTANDFVREFLTMYLRGEFPEEELFEKVLPTYPPIAKRILRDNGIWAKSLRRPNVEVCVERIAEITERGVRTENGEERSFDVIVYGTGFYASRFLMPMKVTGRDGVDLHDRWGGDARAYLGMTVPEFPNLFMMYGPNTNIVINGSIIYFSECETHYILESIRALLTDGFRSMEVRPEVFEEYTAAIDDGNRAMAWGVSTVNTWYKNEKGKITQNWPFSLLEYWERTREVNPKDYVLR